jgi:hypothetical protein
MPIMLCEVYSVAYFLRAFILYSQSRKTLNLFTTDAVTSYKPRVQMVGDDHDGLGISLQHPMNAFYYGHSL